VAGTGATHVSLRAGPPRSRMARTPSSTRSTSTARRSTSAPRPPTQSTSSHPRRPTLLGSWHQSSAGTRPSCSSAAASRSPA
jgi:hypothetical protein